MNALKVHVERVVRPVRADPRRKDHMREELLAHLTAIAEAERGAGGTEEQSVRRAIERFGDPAALRAELQASVPRWERVLHSPCGRFDAPLNAMLRRRPGETPLRHAGRRFSCLVLFLALFNSALIGFKLAAAWVAGPAISPPLGQILHHMATFHGAGLFCAALDLLLILGFNRLMDHGRARIAWATCALAAPVTFAGGMLIYLFPGEGFDPTAPALLAPFVTLVVISPAALAFVAYAERVQERRYLEWERLAIGE